MRKLPVIADQKILLFQTELEVQNEELRSSREILEETVDLYATLYDYAPVGCLSLDENGCIVQMNLTATEFLRCDREQLVGTPLASLLAGASTPVLFTHLRKLASGAKR